MSARSLPSWVFETNEQHSRRLWNATVCAAAAILLVRSATVSPTFSLGLRIPFVVVPGSFPVEGVAALSVGLVVSYYGFGLASCLGVNFVLVAAYVVPHSRPGIFAGHMWVLVGVYVLVSAVYAGLAGTVGFGLGRLARRLAD
ncbi:hypothetical protein C475_21097 [Halosimplex carlsbadense 2-9-1]|uniref:Uncharacterized protein n=1 Tax=Halosimplex carlsbadense 2-9-1 TaxID=797114 RepID=M0CAI9_9EURY|nr:hypothetical protein [Halosimplex carlsbadense]ELZ20311.1 hypothetical protein C475_21097 [Halosimplex carlsbadense 2-9-1]